MNVPPTRAARALLLSGLAVWASACATQTFPMGAHSALGLYKYSIPGEVAFAQDGLSVEILRAQSAASATNYIVELMVRNVGQEEIDFDPSIFELVDDETGIQYPRFVPTGPYAYGLGVLTETPLKPGRALEGRLYFKSAEGKANVDRLVFYMGDETVYLHYEGPISRAEIEARAASSIRH